MVKSGRVESGAGSSRGWVGVVLGSTPCQVGPGRVGIWVESGTGGGRIGVVSVSSRAGSGRGLGRVGDGWGRVGDGSDCNALLTGVTGVLHVDDMAGMRKFAHRLAVADDGSQWSTEILGVDEAYQVLEPDVSRPGDVSDQSRHGFYLLRVTSFQHEGGSHVEGPPQF